MDLIEQVLAAQSSFKIERHALEFNGLCSACK
jgi:Fe2+ or Zn2+ uptake regulation protein